MKKNLLIIIMAMTAFWNSAHACKIEKAAIQYVQSNPAKIGLAATARLSGFRFVVSPSAPINDLIEVLVLANEESLGWELAIMTKVKDDGKCAVEWKWTARVHPNP